MAEFSEVIKNGRRLCASHESCCSDGCPLYYFCDRMTDTMGCYLFRDQNSNMINELEKAITDWAEKNPEPVYPTWEEWLMAQGLIDDDPIQNIFNLGSSRHFNYTKSRNTRIPENIARKLGIKPVNGGVNNGD